MKTPIENLNPSPIHTSIQPPPIFYKKFKIGVYKELYEKGLLTKKQLDALIALQKDIVGSPAEY
ncbi:hypothetical protein FACS1894211_08550 [Clostridia bacterium]|nr:hypothetical protein FACS1894211_08550 [Clostridia bacterium]